MGWRSGKVAAYDWPYREFTLPNSRKHLVYLLGAKFVEEFEKAIAGEVKRDN